MIDLYGFSYCLSGKLKLDMLQFLLLVHGWIFNELIYKEQFNTAQYSPHLRVVANLSQKKF